MSSESIQAIDVHGHYGRYDCGGGAIVNEFMTGDAPWSSGGHGGRTYD